MYVESHALGMPIIAVPLRILVRWCYIIFANGRQIISIPSEWLSTHIQRRAWAHSILSSFFCYVLLLSVTWLCVILQLSEVVHPTSCCGWDKARLPWLLQFKLLWLSFPLLSSSCALCMCEWMNAQSEVEEIVYFANISSQGGLGNLVVGKISFWPREVRNENHHHRFMKFDFQQHATV